MSGIVNIEYEAISIRDQAREGPKFRPKWDPGRSGSLPKKKKIFFFFWETHFHNASCGDIISRQSTTTASVSPSIKWQ